jgi:hypothetical protein
MAIKYTNICHCKPLQNLPILGFFVSKYTIWQRWFKLAEPYLEKTFWVKIYAETSSTWQTVFRAYNLHFCNILATFGENWALIFYGLLLALIKNKTSHGQLPPKYPIEIFIFRA